MTRQQIENQLEQVGEHLHKADENEHAIGNLILATNTLAGINRALISRIESLEREFAPLVRPQPAGVNYHDETEEHVARSVASSPSIGLCMCGRPVTAAEVDLGCASASPLTCPRCVVDEVADMCGL